MTAGQVRALARLDGVRRIEADGRMRALDDSTDSDFGAAAARADTPGLDGSGVGICVVDTGLDPNHEQIAPRQVVFKDFVGTATTPYDDHGHGTHVAAIAAGDGVGGANAATFIGVAPAATLYAAKVLNAAGSGSDSDVVAGIQWCHGQPGVDVISMSLGGGGGDGTDAASLAVDQAVAGGDVVVVAAGNSGDEPGTVAAPGVAASAITVGAVSDHSAPAGTDRRDNGIWLAAFSSRGPTSDGRLKPDIAAPGVTVRSAQANTAAGYVTYSGTSMATPYVAGAVALALEAAPGAVPASVKAAITAAAVDVGPTGSDNDWGAGLIDVRAFVDTISGSGSVRRTAFPSHLRVTGTVPDDGFLDVPITVPSEGVGVPLAVTVTLDGEPVCYFFCLIVEWSPDLDAELRGPGGGVLATSECALSGVSCGIGRQETIGIRPTVEGTYVLRVSAFAGEPNYGAGGTFSADIFHGPLGGAVEPPPPPPANVAPVADAGPDQTVKVGKNGQARFSLDGSGSSDSDGAITSYLWRHGTTQVGSTAQVALSRPVGTYSFSLTVTDDDAATDTDLVTVTVVKRGRG
jgi:serine protease AprX